MLSISLALVFDPLILKLKQSLSLLFVRNEVPLFFLHAVYNVESILRYISQGDRQGLDVVPQYQLMS